MLNSCDLDQTQPVICTSSLHQIVIASEAQQSTAMDGCASLAMTNWVNDEWVRLPHHLPGLCAHSPHQIVIASEAQQSTATQPTTAMDCCVAPLLAMTDWVNDGSGQCRMGPLAAPSARIVRPFPTSDRHCKRSAAIHRDPANHRDGWPRRPTSCSDGSGQCRIRAMTDWDQCQMGPLAAPSAWIVHPFPTSDRHCKRSAAIHRDPANHRDGWPRRPTSCSDGSGQ